MLDREPPVTGFFSRKQRTAQIRFVRASHGETIVFLPTGTNRDEYRVFKVFNGSGGSEICGDDAARLVRECRATWQRGWLTDFHQLAAVMGTGVPHQPTPPKKSRN